MCGLHALFVLQGDDSESVIRFTNRMLGDDDEADEPDDLDEVDLSVFHYLPLTVAAAQVDSEAAFLKERGWQRPRGGEIALIAVDGQQKTLATVTIGVKEAQSATRQAEQFLAQHKPAFEDAQVSLARARAQARRDGRRVWIIFGGPLCNPCIELARWIDRHHAVLEKDYVIVKLMAGLQPHADEIRTEIGGAEHGVPWFAITESDGKILITSESPLGNIGLPGTIEDLRHFRKMLNQTSHQLSSEEIDELIQSLSAQR